MESLFSNLYQLKSEKLKSKFKIKHVTVNSPILIDSTNGVRSCHAGSCLCTVQTREGKFNSWTLHPVVVTCTQPAASHFHSYMHPVSTLSSTLDSVVELDIFLSQSACILGADPLTQDGFSSQVYLNKHPMIKFTYLLYMKLLELSTSKFHFVDIFPLVAK